MTEKQIQATVRTAHHYGSFISKVADMSADRNRDRVLDASPEIVAKYVQAAPFTTNTLSMKRIEITLDDADAIV